MKTNTLLRYILITAVVLIIFAVVGKKQGWFGKQELVKVAVQKATRQNIVETITANGKVQPETEIKITPDVSGEIVELHVSEGDFVTKGTFLARIKPEVYISSRDRTRATMNSSKARQAQAEAQFLQSELSFKRNEKLWKEMAISEAEYETALSNYQVAKSELEAAEYSVKSAEATLKEAEENLTKTSIYAPMTGTVSMLRVEQGERVLGTQMMSGTEMMRIADMTKMEVKVEVNENDIVRVNLLDTAIIEVDAYLGDKFKGIVTEIANAASTTGLSADQVTNFDVKVLLLQESYNHLYELGYKNPLRPGMSATVDIQTDIKNNVLTVPIQAVTTRADSSLEKREEERPLTENQNKNKEEENVNEVVFMADEEGKAMIRIVKTGIQDNINIEILEGLNDGDEIVIAPYSAISKKLKVGTPLEIVEEKDLYTDNKKRKEKKDEE